MLRIIAAVSVIIVLSSNVIYAEYSPSELCVINWGDNVDQLKIGEPDYDETSPPDSTTSKWIETSG
jgi:hypothetical protein